MSNSSSQFIKTANFTGSYPSVETCPKSQLNEYAFIGRSNVGKSSLINMLTENSKLAKISSTPGKTRMINHFIINDEWTLVDLPGYGYAKISKIDREKFKDLNRNYISKRGNLVCLFILIDSRIPPQKNDLEFIDWVGENLIPFVLVFTKVDKLSKAVWKRNVENYKIKLLETWDSLPQIFETSSEKSIGKEDIYNFISETNNNINS